MRWKRKLSWGLAVLMVMVWLAIPLVYADEGIIETYKPNAKIDLSLHLSNSTGNMESANCSVQIKNETFGTILDSLMNNTGGGWYNSTYNTSKSGKYYCRQNCTKDTRYVANTCDFIVKGDSQVPIAVMIAMAIVIAVLFFLSRYVQIEALKYLLVSIAAIMTMMTLAIGLFLAKDSLPASVQEMMSTAYIVLIYTLDFIIAIGFLFIIMYYATKWLPSTFRRKK